MMKQEVSAQPDVTGDVTNDICHKSRNFFMNATY